MKVYVSSHDRWAALHVAGAISAAGHTIVSTWHDDAPGGTASLSPEGRVDAAVQNLHRVCRADALVLVAATDKVPGGKFVEAGVAIGLSKPVAVLGRRENLLMWHPFVYAFDTPDEIVENLHVLVKEVP